NSELQQHKGAAPPSKDHKAALDTMPESDAYSTATENSTLWCEICEASGHDILSCTNVFGSEHQAKGNGSSSNPDEKMEDGDQEDGEFHEAVNAAGIKPAPLSPLKPSPKPGATPTT